MAYQGNLLSKTLVIGIILLFIGINAFNVAALTSIEKQISVTQNNKSKQAITTLIAESNGNRVIEVDSAGTIVWQITGLDWPTDVERLANGNTLISEYFENRVIEVDNAGTIVWQKSGLDSPPIDAERLLNGNTLISEFFNKRVIEVDSAGTIVWQKSGLDKPTDVERLSNGNTLITEYDLYNPGRVIEVDRDGTIVWQKAGLNFPVDAERLVNGNTLITETSLGNRVIEVDSNGTIVWQKGGLNSPEDAERLPNGNTLITEYGNRVLEVDSNGTIVWQKAGLVQPYDAERISNSPDAPTIDGEKSGKPGKEYEYTFTAVDPDGDDVKYYIDWEDNSTEWTGFYVSGAVVKVKHNWSEKGDYTIKAKAVDTYGAVSDWAEFDVTIPRNIAITNSWFQWFLDRFSLLDRLLYLLRVI